MIVSQRPQRHQSFLFSFLLLAALTSNNPHHVQAFPSVILTSTAAKCVQLDVSQETVLLIGYEAPDINKYRDDNAKDEGNRRTAFEGKDMTLLVFQRDTDQDRAERKDKQGRREKKTGTGKVRMQLEEETGVVDFYTGNSAGVVEICQQSYKATPSKPRRLALNVTQRVASVQEQMKKAPISETDEEKIPDKEQSNAILNVETSRISLELKRMGDKLDQLAGHAEMSKERDEEFHQKQVKLAGAVKIWPIFRIAVVIGAGVVQVYLVVSYMKSRRIY